MKRLLLRIFWATLLVALLLMSNEVPAQQKAEDSQLTDIKTEKPDAAPNLADLVPSATELSRRLVLLEKRIADELNVSAVEKSYAEIVTKMEAHSGELQKLKDEKDHRYSELIELKTAILAEAASLHALSDPLAEAIREIEALRKEWVAEQKKWSEWKVSLLEDEALEEVKLIFRKAQKIIDTALSLILKQLKPMLAAQQKAGNIQARIDSLATETKGLIVAIKDTVLVDSSPPMLSSRYFSQFESGLWDESKKGLDEFQWPEREFFERQGWVALFQFLIALVLVIAIFRHRKQLERSEHWRFVGKRPFSAGLFVGLVTLNAFYEGAPATWTLAFTVVAGISFARLLSCLIETSWKRQVVYWLVILFVATRLLHAVGLPLPLFRIYLFVAALAGLFLCIWWAVAARRHGDSLLYSWGLRLGSLFFAVLLVLELWGRSGLAEYLFESVVRTVSVVLAGWLLIHLAHGGLEWAFQSSSLHKVTFLQSYTATMVRRFKILADTLVGLLVVSSLLMIWRVYESPVASVKGLLSLGFTLGSQRISLGLVIIAAGFVYGSFLLSWAAQKLFVEAVLPKRRLDTGARISISRLIHYVLVTVGFFLALIAIGFELTKFTIVLSALGIGIGFGLQAIVNNFICGIILLFERPVRVGDYIEVGGEWVVVKKIGLRSTIVQSFDRADIIIPNADLITHQVTNWTLTDRSVRITIPVGVAHGSDVPLVIETLMQCATANAKVVRTPEPQVLFKSFGESSLDFELRVWTSDVDNKLGLDSALHQEIFQKFREAGIEIAFPQRDLHIRSVEEDQSSKVKGEWRSLSDSKVTSEKEDKEKSQ